MNEPRRLLKTDGSETAINGRINTQQVCKLIGATALDVVRISRHEVMFVDDDGYGKGLPVNAMATKLYHDICRPGTTHRILGDVVITLDADFS